MSRWKGEQKRGKEFTFDEKKYLATCGIKEAGRGSATKPDRLTSPRQLHLRTKNTKSIFEKRSHSKVN